MVEVVVVVREVGRVKPDYSLKFDLPAVPGVGSYISIQRPDKIEPFGEDLIVRQVWWQLGHPETRGGAPVGGEKVGRVNEIIVECDPAIGPYSSDDWIRLLDGAKARGIEVAELEITRLSVRETSLKSLLNPE